MTDDLKQRLRAVCETGCDPDLPFEAADRIEQLEASIYGVYELEAERDKLKFALENVRLFAARHRKEDWARLILGFCAEGGVVGSVTR